MGLNRNTIMLLRFFCFLEIAQPVWLLVDWEIFDVKMFSSAPEQQISNMQKIKNTYMHTLSSDEIFLTQTFKTQIIFSMKFFDLW